MIAGRTAPEFQSSLVAAMPEDTTTAPCLDPTVAVVVNQSFNVGWSSPVARRAHNPKVASSNLAPATNLRRAA